MTEKVRKVTVAVDPDCDKSGLARFDGERMEAFCAPFPMLVERIRQWYSESACEVIVEAGWLNEGNWHLPPSCTARMGAAIGCKTGRNQETGRKIVEMLRHYGIAAREIKPLRKFWQGKDRKITAEELNRQLQARGVAPLGRTSQDARDAALMALAYHG